MAAYEVRLALEVCAELTRSAHARLAFRDQPLPSKPVIPERQLDYSTGREGGRLVVKWLSPGGMAERLKAHVLKTCLGFAQRGFESHFLRLIEGGRERQLKNGEVPEWLNGLAC